MAIDDIHSGNIYLSGLNKLQQTLVVPPMKDPSTHRYEKMIVKAVQRAIQVTILPVLRQRMPLGWL